MNDPEWTEGREMAHRHAEALARIAEVKPRRLKIGDVLPPKERKLDIRPAFTGAGAPSFKPARSGRKLGK